jgi:inhibitor of KinA
MSNFMLDTAHSPAYPRLLPVGDQAVTVEFGASIDDVLNRRVFAFADAVEHAAIRGVGELVPAYRSLLVQYDPETVAYDELAARLEGMARGIGDPTRAGRQPRVILEVPVVYGGDYGPDLVHVARNAGLSQEEVIRVHSHVPYRVYMIGFSPGFPYLGGVDPRIACPRLKTPRTRVPAGSVGIAETQTGVYPNESPGGWQLIGRTPVRLFDPAAVPPALARPGEFIQFVPIDHARYEDIAAAVQAGTYVPRVMEGAP